MSSAFNWQNPKIYTGPDDRALPHGGLLQQGWMEGPRLVTVNTLIRKERNGESLSAVEAAALAKLHEILDPSPANWNGNELDYYEDIHAALHKYQYRDGTYAFALDPVLQTLVPTAQEQKPGVVPMRFGDVRSLLQEYGHPDAVFDKAVEARWQRITGLPAAEGEAMLRSAIEAEKDLDGETYYELPELAEVSSAADFAFDSLEGALAPVAKNKVTDLGPAIAAVGEKLKALEQAVAPPPGATGRKGNPRKALSLIRAARVLVKNTGSDRESQRRALDLTHKAVANDIAHWLNDDDPQFEPRIFDSTPVVR